MFVLKMYSIMKPIHFFLLSISLVLCHQSSAQSSGHSSDQSSAQPGTPPCQIRFLPRDAWTDEVYEALEKTIREAPEDSYAVFDFDNTTIINDISMTLMSYMVENLKFVFPKEDAFKYFTAFLPDIDSPLKGVGKSARELAQTMSKDYQYLQKALEKGRKLEKLKKTKQWKRLKANLFLLNDGIEYTFDYDTWCLWMPALFSGMTYEQLAEITRESVDYWMSRSELILPQESLHLIQALRRKGIDVYICSASLEAIVEAMACEPKYGLNFPEEKVYGIRLKDKEIVGGAFEEDYQQTFLEGKVACIKRFMSPQHGGKDPILVAGDSSGDLAMLTAFPKALSLVFDCNRGGSIGEYIKNKPQNAVVQPRYQYTPNCLTAF
ncbi:MAG: HAD family hydrolase [Candidatus Cryptobacteroides sp.]